MLSLKQLLAHKKSGVSDLCGIYFLFDKEEIVYIGQSVSCVSRIKVHETSNKKFDSYFIEPIEEKCLQQTEEEYIYKYTPKYNKRISTKDNSIFVTKKWLWENRDKIKPQKVEACIMGGQIFIKKNNLHYEDTK